MYNVEPSVVLYADELKENSLKTQAFSSDADGYGMRVSHIF